MSDTEWIYIPGFSNYRVNAKGEIFSIRRAGSDGRVLKPTINAKGYPCVVLYGDDGRKKNFKIHNIVALVFHGPRPTGLVARHLNGDQLDNRPENLTYGTVSENNTDLVSHGTHHEAVRTHCDSGHEFTPENTMRRIGKNGKTYRKCKRCHAAYIARYRSRRKAGLTPNQG